ncbi:hypothetical protein [Mesorhizobium sp.]|nr:hypothetical protein [Mesorhizobium sp.]
MLIVAKFRGESSTSAMEFCDGNSPRSIVVYLLHKLVDFAASAALCS